MANLVKRTALALVALAAIGVTTYAAAALAAQSTQKASMNEARALSARGSPVRADQFESATVDVDAATESLVLDEPHVSDDFSTQFAMGFTLSIASGETGSICYVPYARTSSTSCATACAALETAATLTCTLTGDVAGDGKALRPGQTVTEWITGADCLCAEGSEANVDVNVAQISRYPGG